MISVRRRAAAFARIAAFVSAIWTTLLAGYVLGWQSVAMVHTGEWTPFPMSRVLALAAKEERSVYVTASVPDHPPTTSSGLSNLTDWLLDLPASGVLLFGAAILLAFSTMIGSMEKRLAAQQE